ncbi:MAG: SurA N-terminal domain-containing protein [Gammaproteobacteria bacterium]|nr:SurA N-terminal domain-containing protein [Gammaproteobacteria bacterium]
MLQNIRDLVSGWLAAVIFVLLIVPFAFWGINYYFGTGGEVVAAEVNGSPITLRDYQQSVQDLRQRLRDLVTGMSPAEQDQFLKKRALEVLIHRELLNQADAELGLRISDAQVRGTIESVPYFQGDAGFDPNLYQSNIRAVGLSAAGFEAQVRKDMMAEQLQTGLIESAFVTDAEARRLAGIRGQRRDIRYAVLSADALKENIAVAEEDVQKYYETRGDEFMDPERVRLAYIELSAEAVAGEVTATDDDLRGYYEDNHANYGLAEQREIRQLLVTLPEKAPPAQVGKAKKRAEAIVGELNGGKSMQEIATGQDLESDTGVEYSEFGFLTRGVLEPEVDEVAFALKEGERSNPIQSKFGLHIVQVTRLKGGETGAFEDVREQVDRDYRRAEAEKRFFDRADRLATLAFENPDSLDTAAEDLGLTLRESELISRDYVGTDALGNPRVMEAAFSDDVLREGNNSELIELDNTHAVVLRVLEHVRQQKKPLDQVREQAVTRIKIERARDQIRARGEAVRARLKGGAVFGDVASEFGLEWIEASGVRMDDPNINRAILREAFSLGTPASGSAVFGGVSLGTGDFAVVAVTGRHDPKPDALDDRDVKAVRDELRQNTGTRVWRNYIDELRRTADVVVFEERIQ